MGIGAISHQEILAWSTLTGIKVTTTEIAALKAVDTKFREYQYKKTNPDRPLGSLSAQFQALKDEADKGKEQRERARAKAAQKAVEKGKAKVI